MRCGPVRGPEQHPYPRVASCAASHRRFPLLMMLIDSHCHLDFPDFVGELDALIVRARAADGGEHSPVSPDRKSVGERPKFGHHRQCCHQSAPSHGGSKGVKGWNHRCPEGKISHRLCRSTVVLRQHAAGPFIP